MGRAQDRAASLPCRRTLSVLGAVGVVGALWMVGCSPGTDGAADVLVPDVVSGDVAAAPDEVTTPDPCTGTCISHGFGILDVPAGSESDGVCLSWTLENDEPLYVTAVLSENDGMFHHSNWFWVPENHWNMPDGDWSCSEQGFDELNAAVFGGVIFAQSTQVMAEEQRFLPGAAIKIGARARIIANSHVLNPTPEDVQTEMRVTLDTIAEDEVTMHLQPFRFTYVDLDIPAQSRAEHFASCDLAAGFNNILDGDFDLRLHYILPHVHALGDRFRLEIVGGERDGEALYDETNLYGHATGFTFEEPLSLAEIGAEGFRFLCGHDNPTESTVGWGIGDQEMCVMLGFAESAARYDLSVSNTDAYGMDDDGTFTRTGPCVVVPIPSL